ncbi:MAG: flagellar protein FlaG [Gammaproteobacteria bacterium]|nr:flagellar protein FlaG [Gammaproteobacteria bacterium]
MMDVQTIQPNTVGAYLKNATPVAGVSSERANVSMLPKGGSDTGALTQKSDETNATQSVHNGEVALSESVKSNADMDTTLENINIQLERLKTFLRFERDEDTQRMVIFIKNGDTGEVIRQIPSNEFLKISKNINDFIEMRQQRPNDNSLPTGLITHSTV